jgi:Carboxylesterase family
LIFQFQAESLFTVYEPIADFDRFDKYKNDPSLYVPYAFKLNKSNQAEINEVVTKFKQIYFNGSDPSLLEISDWVQFQSDSMFNYPIDRTIRYHAKKSAPLYYYTFSMDGAFNLLKGILLLTPYDGACHADVRILNDCIRQP